MFCSPSYERHNDSLCFLINKNSSNSHLVGSPKQNSLMKGSFEAKTTKISLRKIHQSCLKPFINHSLKRNDEKMVSSHSECPKVQRRPKQIFNPQKILYFDYSIMRSQTQIKTITDNAKQQMPSLQMVKIQSIRVPSLKHNSSPLQTLRMQKHQTNQASNLKKTRKTIKFSQQLVSSPLKQSLVSIQSDYNYKQRLEQSLILVDYFHPSQLKLQELSPFILEAERHSLSNNTDF